MNERWIQRFLAWLCRRIGHRGVVDYNSVGGGDPELCRRCGELLSTAYSRAASAKDRQS